MANFYQIGPLFEIGYHLYQSQFILVPNAGGAQFGQPIFYDNAHHPSEVPAGDDGGAGDNILRPSGFRKGDKYTSPKGGNVSTNFFDTATTNPFIIGWGSKIGSAFWIEIDQPFDWSRKNYPGVYDALKGTFAGENTVFTATRVTSRVFVWCIALQFTAQSGTTIISQPQPPPRKPPVATKLGQSVFDAIGRNIPYSKGARRLRGAKIWAIELESGDTEALEPAYGNWAESFGYPLHPGEEIYVNKLWFDGNIAWTLEGGVQMENIGEELDFVFYQGTEDQEPDEKIVADKGETRVPGFRGQIYIRFSDVTLAGVGNRMPEVEVEIRRSDEQRISVSEALEDVGVLGGVDVVCSGIEDMADGVVFETMNPRGILEDYAEIYGYRIVDGDPVRLIRRQVNEALTIDHTITVDDLADEDSDDVVISVTRKEDTELPNKITLTHMDMSQSYSRRPQHARRPQSPIPVTTSKKNEEIDTDFIITAVEGVTLAHEILYRIWARRLGAEFRVSSDLMEVEESDVLRVPTAQGTFIMDVADRKLQPDDTTELSVEYLLAETGATLTADAGDGQTGVRPACYYPQMILIGNGFVGGGSFAVDENKIFASVACQGDNGIGAASTNIPTRLSQRNIVFHPANSFFSGFAINKDYVFPHTLSVYVAENDIESQLWVLKADRLNLKSVETIKFLDAEELGIRLPSINDLKANSEFLYACGAQNRLTGYTLLGSELYEGQALLFIFDIADFTREGTQIVDIAVPDGYIPAGSDIQICDDYIIINCFAKLLGIGDIPEDHVDSVIVRYAIATGVQDYILPEHPLGHGCYAPDGFVYYMPNNYHLLDSSTVYLANTMGARVDPRTLEIVYFDITDDPNVLISAIGNRPWCDDTNLYFLTNNLGGVSDVSGYIPGYVNAPYLAVRTLADLGVATGMDLTTEFDNLKYQVHEGGSDSLFHYLGGMSQGIGNNSHATFSQSGCLLKLAKDLTYSIFYPAQGFQPVNDDFPGTSISLGQRKTFNNEWATKQDGEPDHLGNIGGASLWWTFAATEDGVYTATVDDAAGTATYADFNFAIYTGNAVDALTLIAGGPVPSDGSIAIWPDSLTWNGVAGQKYRIVVDGWYGRNFEDDAIGSGVNFGSGVLTVTRDETPSNDDFADAAVIGIGTTIEQNSNFFATKEVGEPDHGGNSGGRSLWWKVTPTDPEVSALRVTTDSDQPVVISVYTQSTSPSGFPGLVEVGADADEHTATDLDYAAWMAAI